jgi:peptidoglycan/LPS O-acetylase OafA/YrhL
MAEKEAKERFGSLDGVRSLAFLMVFVSHAFKHFSDQIHFEDAYVNQIFGSLSRPGNQGVLIFFVLSGFLITYLLLREKQQYGQINLKYFYVRRALRIWPLFYASIIFTLFIFPYLAKAAGIECDRNGNTLMNLFFLNNFDVMRLTEEGQAGFNPMLQITWSIAIEEQYYLVWPLFFLIFPIRLFPLLVFPVLFFISFTFSIYHYSDSAVLYFHTLSVMSALLTGGLVAYLSFRYQKFKMFFETLPDGYRLLLYVTGFVLLAMKNMMIGKFGSFFIPMQVLMPFFAFLILDQAFTQSHFLKFNIKSSFSRLGILTYSLYLLHPLSILFCQSAFDYLGLRYKTEIPVALALGLITLPFTIALSYVSYTYFESFFLRFKDSFYPQNLQLS